MSVQNIKKNRIYKVDRQTTTGHHKRKNFIGTLSPVNSWLWAPLLNKTHKNYIFLFFTHNNNQKKKKWEKNDFRSCSSYNILLLLLFYFSVFNRLFNAHKSLAFYTHFFFFTVDHILFCFFIALSVCVPHCRLVYFVWCCYCFSSIPPEKIIYIKYHNNVYNNNNNNNIYKTMLFVFLLFDTY